MSYDSITHNHEESDERLLSRSEAAKKLGVKPSTLAAWAYLKTQDLPFVRVGSRVKYRQGDVRDFILRNTIGHGGSGT